MEQMYKVFFKDRIIFFDEDISSSFNFKPGLFYKYNNTEELKELVYMFFKLDKIEHFYISHHDIEVLRQEFISCFRFIKASGGLVRNNKGELLIIRRNDVWDLPKGKNSPGESSKQAALREVREECGISKLKIIKEITKTYHTYYIKEEPVLKETTWFEMNTDETKDPTPQKDENISEVRWIASDNIDFITTNTYLSILEVLRKNTIL